MNRPSIDPSAFVASTATVFGNVIVGPRAVVLFGAVLRAEHGLVSVGAETNIQDHVVVHCGAGFPVNIGARVTIGHNAVVHGATLGDHSLVGAGGLVLDGAELGEGSWLAAGGVLSEGDIVPPWTLAMGSPAKAIRELTPAEIDRQRRGVIKYLDLGELYRGSDGLSD
jgi:carbonic anhydrase/acetyltransferase-like protein (isoleucine patch superfamily)